MECPHCQTLFHSQFESDDFLYLKNGGVKKRWIYKAQKCPDCGEGIIFLTEEKELIHPKEVIWEEERTIMGYPQNATGRHLPSEVPEAYRGDFNEAALVLSDSPRATATLSRFLLQKFIRNEFNIYQNHLTDEIDEFLEESNSPPWLEENVHAVRRIGIFGAHPLEQKRSEQKRDLETIIEVSYEEADWALELIESLFRYHFVMPERQKERRDKLNEKLKDAGKKPLEE